MNSFITTKLEPNNSRSVANRFVWIYKLERNNNETQN